MVRSTQHIEMAQAVAKSVVDQLPLAMEDIEKLITVVESAPSPFPTVVEDVVRIQTQMRELLETAEMAMIPLELRSVEPEISKSVATAIRKVVPTALLAIQKVIVSIEVEAGDSEVLSSVEQLEENMEALLESVESST